MHDTGRDSGDTIIARHGARLRTCVGVDAASSEGSLQLALLLCGEVSRRRVRRCTCRGSMHEGLQRHGRHGGRGTTACSLLLLLEVERKQEVRTATPRAR
jgi:hypothetical protein